MKIMSPATWKSRKGFLEAIAGLFFGKWSFLFVQIKAKRLSKESDLVRQNLHLTDDELKRWLEIFKKNHI